MSVDPITREYPDLTPFQFASNSPINSIDLDGLEKDEIIDAISKGSSWTGRLLKETAYGIAATVAHPIDAGVAIVHSTKKTVSQVGYLGGVFVQGVGYAFGGKQIEVNQEEFDKTAQELSKGMVKTGVLAVVTAGVGEAAGAAVKTKAVAESAKIVDTNLKALSTEAATAVKGGFKNERLAGQNHPKTGVPFDKNGYPDFSEHLYQGGTNEVTITPSRTRPADFKAANQAAGYSETPAGFTWHHHQNPGKMQLVEKEIHKKTGHTGGFSKNKPN